MFDNDITRRAFLGGTAKTAALLFVAPAIVKAENLMKIWVPPEKKIITDPWPDYDFQLVGLHRGDQVYVQDATTGHVLHNKVVNENRLGMDLPNMLGHQLRVGIRRNGYIDFNYETLAPTIEGSQVKIVGEPLRSDKRVIA